MTAANCDVSAAARAVKYRPTLVSLNAPAALGPVVNCCASSWYTSSWNVPKKDGDSPPCCRPVSLSAAPGPRRQKAPPGPPRPSPPRTVQAWPAGEKRRRKRKALSALGSRLSALGSRLSALGSRLSALGSRLSALGSRLSALGSRLSALGSRLSALGSRLSALGSRLSALGSRLMMV